MITEEYVSFETAKLLKEKGFDEATRCDFSDKGLRWFNDVLVQHNSQGGIACPTLQMALKWIREVHNVVIVVDYIYECTDKSYCYKIYKLGENGKPDRVAINGVRYSIDGTPSVETVGYRDYSLSFFSYKTYEEACEAAIKYCLDNLI